MIKPILFILFLVLLIGSITLAPTRCNVSGSIAAQTNWAGNNVCK